MPDETTQPDIRGLIEARDFATLKASVGQMEIHDLTELLAELVEEDLGIVFRLLPHETAAEIFGDLPFERQEYLLEALSSEKVARVLNDMPPDERTELLEELPGQLAQRLLNSLRGEQLAIARRLLNYPEDSIGRLMTPEYVAVRADWDIERVFEHIRQVASDKETLNVIYVIDERCRLLDELTLEQLVLAEKGATVADVMDAQVASLAATDDQESAVDEFKKYEAIALPVVDRQGVLVGIVTHDDVLDVVEEEDTEDFQKMAGMGALEYSYFATGHLGMIKKRLPWLLMLLFAQMLGTLALTSFHGLEMFAVLVIFMPLINSPAGNTGSQMAGLMIRGLAVQEMDLSDWGRILRRELLRGVAMGLTLAVIGYVATYIFAPMVVTGVGRERIGDIAMSVALAIASAVMVANILGSMLPFFFKRLGVDPAVISGPFIASLMDVTSILIYFGIAVGILHLAD